MHFILELAQHYVPQSILRNFKCEAKVAQPKIFCLSKKSCKIFASDIIDTAAERDYYNKKESSKLPSDDYDAIFDKLDNDIAPILQKIIAESNITCIDKTEREHLDKFTASQYLRTPAIRGITKRFNSEDKDEAREFHSRTLIDPNEKANIFAFLNSVFNGLELSLIKSDNDNQFIIGDSPVLFDPTAHGIFFPINPDYCLHYYHGEPIPLPSMCINRLEFLGADSHVYAKTEKSLNDVLDNIKNNAIDDFCKLQNQNSYWQCILTNSKYWQCNDIHINPFDICIKKFANAIYKPLADCLISESL